MKILSIPLLSHDSSICIFEDGEIISYKMEERFSRNKHDLNLSCVLDLLIAENNFYFDVIIVSSYFLKEFVTPIEIVKEKIKKLSYKKLIFADNEHHLYHAYSGFYNSGFDESICFSIDASGAINENKIEVESIYKMSKNQKEIAIYKKTRDFKFNGHKSYKEYYKNIPCGETSVGEDFCKISEDFGYHPLDGAGKVMGIAQYKKNKKKLQFPYNSKEWKKKVDIAYELQNKTQEYVLNLIKKYTTKTGIKNVVISGGYGLNCVANYHYLRNLKNINIYIDPICFDAGISIGTAYYYYIQLTQNNPPIQPLKNVYIGYEEKKYNFSNIETKKVSYEDVVDLLVDKKAVAIFQGKSEAGQRALGNRSLLFDPRIFNGKDLVNKIKRRENFRPFAGSILLEESNKWFDMGSLKESPYMQFAVKAFDDTIRQVPSIIHADNTCRIQTVTKEQNNRFYELIFHFFKKTGIPMLLNTSFNLAGEPLVETFDQAITTLKNSSIEYLYLPEKELLVSIKNKNIFYE